MNIYFSGIGGVGLGPLAEIALDAGHTVSGSDASPSPMTGLLKKRGVLIEHDQAGNFLEKIHAVTPVDWFVYTAAMRIEHPEVVMAKKLGIKISKRDELLSHIIKERNLKLIGIAGTHGKTTTTAMMVWSMKQLGIPVSYSVGTTLSFGPSGHFDPKSEYFIYECDEFDKNFLHFHPYLSIITSLDYDHPDTFHSEDDYRRAFTQFIRQSDWTIMWHQDATDLGEIEKSWLLTDSDVANVRLAGVHNRKNASLVMKALEKLSIQGNARDALNSFPGSDRRFERLAENLYSDYGHHPKEIAATLQLARELNDDIVLVYQPHQNIRQHELHSQYADCFELASDVYWLPTYLTRENPNLKILSPEELSSRVTNKKAVHIADLDENLWYNIELARKRGALVICMGAGTIDDWVRRQINS